MPTWLIFLTPVCRQMVRNPGGSKELAALVRFKALARFPERLGQLKFYLGHIFGMRTHFLEYK